MIFSLCFLRLLVAKFFEPRIGANEQKMQSRSHFVSNHFAKKIRAYRRSFVMLGYLQGLGGQTGKSASHNVEQAFQPVHLHQRVGHKKAQDGSSEAKPHVHPMIDAKIAFFYFKT